ncbi:MULTISPECIES: hypothetical protein [unclassified Wolbachia]|nr:MULTISPECIES: hypothetical protein [unclassified Wolbachia]
MLEFTCFRTTSESHFHRADNCRVLALAMYFLYTLLVLKCRPA